MLSLNELIKTTPQRKESYTFQEGRIQEQPFPVPHLSTLRRYFPPRDGYPVILGICDDGLPLIAQLSSSDPGSYLALSDSQEFNRPLVDVLLANLVDAWGMGGPQVLWLAPDDFGPAFHITQNLDPGGMVVDTHTVLDFLGEIKNTALQVRDDHSASPSVVLIIDGLETILHQHGTEVRDRIHWLNVMGPDLGVKIFASFALEGAVSIDDQLLHSFGLIIQGPIRHPSWNDYVNGSGGFYSATVSPGRQFVVALSGELISFWLPGID